MKKKLFYIIGIIVLAVILGFVFFSKGKGGELQVNTQVVKEDLLELQVTATGYLQPVDKVEVGTQVSGEIKRIFVDFNSPVKKGDRLAEIDKLTLTERVTQAQASLESSVSALKYAQQNYDRTKTLFDQKAATQTAYEDANNQLIQAKTSLVNAEANLSQAKVNLGYADIYSPIDGVVLDRAVDEGQTVAASFSTPTMFTIAKDLKNMQIEADVDEADIGMVKNGQKVAFSVDAYPDDVFTGTVLQIRLQPVVTNNVVTYTVVIDAPNPEEKLFPGMTANITIITKGDRGLLISNEALHFQPAPDYMLRLHFPAPESNAAAFSATKGIWVKLPENKYEYRSIETGITDGIQTIVKSGLQAGDEVIMSIVEAGKFPKPQGGGPFMPGPPR
ncbi:hemolysin D [Bacteroidia bacterium]|nr:hemolysin D [Bacteroidia bacterium]GHV70235.1 hemolysin D [Bacteroidia bacterium]